MSTPVMNNQVLARFKRLILGESVEIGIKKKRCNKTPVTLGLLKRLIQVFLEGVTI